MDGLPIASSVVGPSRRWLVRAGIAAGVVLALIGALWLAVPPLVRAQLESRLTAALSRPTTVERVDFNPFTLKLALHNVAVTGLVAVDEIDADVSVASLRHWAPVFDALKVVRPRVTLARDGQGRYSVQDLVDAAASGPTQPAPGFSLNNIEIADGSIVFEDGTTGGTHRIDKLAIGVPFLSTLPYETEITVRPQLAGAFDGAHFALTGRAVPFAAHREATLAIDVDALPLRTYVPYLPRKPRVDLARGNLTTRLQVVFVEGAAGERRLEVRGDARLDDVAVQRRDGSSLAASRRVAVALDRVDVLGRDVRVARLDVEDPQVDVQRLADGSLELARPLLEGAAGPDGAGAAPWRVAVASASVKGGVLSLRDATSGFKAKLAEVALDARNVTADAGGKAHLALSFVSDDRVAAFKGEGDVDLSSLTATGTFELSRFALGPLFPYYRDVLAVDVQKGSLDLAARFELNADGNLRLADGKAAIANLALAYPGNRQPFATLPTIAATGIALDVGARKVDVAELRSIDASVKLVRERDGTLDVGRIIRTSATTGTARDESTWTLAVAKGGIERAALDVEDRMAAPAVKIAVRDLTLDATRFSNARGAKPAVALRARVGKRGRVAWNGVIATNPVALAGRLDVAGLDLVSVRPYLEAYVDATLTGGALAAQGALAVETGAPGPARASWKGSVVVTEFAALDKPTSSDLLRWKKLALDEVDFTSEPLRVSVGRVGVDDYFARLIVYPDGTLNLTRLLGPETEAEGDRPRASVPVTLGRIELVNGNVNYSDYFVKPNYSANLTEVTGSVTTMSAERAGDIALAARVDHTAPVEVSGRLQPFAQELSLDIKAKARDVDLPPLTPYSVKYAGYGIEKGKLTFDVHYVVENRKLSAENRLVLDQLMFNPQRVDSPTATRLPVLLAVALLRDTRGVIDIQLPISGSLDDPQFSVGGLIVRVIVNLIAKAATAPFALLSAAFGHGNEELSQIAFAPGAATVADEATPRLDTLGKALADRPALKLEIAGSADPRIDREALRRAQVESALKRQKMKALADTGDAPASLDQVAIGGDERARWLAAAYRASGSDKRPRNAFGLLKDVPPDEMESLLLGEARVDDDALRELANARAQAVKDALVTRNVPGERLFIVAPKPLAEGTAARVELALR